MYKQQQQKSSACPFLSVNQLDTEEKKKKKITQKTSPPKLQNTAVSFSQTTRFSGFHVRLLAIML